MTKKKHLKNFNIYKLLSIIASIIAIVLLLNSLINFIYNKKINNFYTNFNSCNFVEAENIINDSDLIYKIKNNDLKNDLKEYFTSIISILCSGMKDGSIETDKALSILKEIDQYNILNSSLDKLIYSLDEDYIISKDSYDFILELAKENCSEKNYSKAISLINKIPESETNYYSKGLEIIEDCKASYKNDIFTQADALATDDYYTKAIEFLNSADIELLPLDDTELIAKVQYIEKLRNIYLAELNDENTETTSTNVAETITLSTINTLNISSDTSYLIYVSLKDQLVSIFTGSTNTWDLAKSFSCSTGIPSEITPTGVFSITNRGDWFYSDEYQQGGKYWVQFYGDYLFHSVPYDESQTTIVDSTLGTPASHGCIRLATDDAKWLYDNAPDNTKVIIN